MTLAAAQDLLGKPGQINFIGIASAKNWERGKSRSHLRAADQF